MTTPMAEKFYLAQHQLEMEGKRFAIHNPKNLAIAKLPAIYGFNNGGNPGRYTAVAIAEDGKVLGDHLCSDEAYMLHDLGILEGTRRDRHEESYREHYPNGYRMEFVQSDKLNDHVKVNRAYARYMILKREEKQPPYPKEGKVFG